MRTRCSIALTVAASKPAATISSRDWLLVDVAQQDRVQHVVGRQRILVGLVLAQFRRRRPRDHGRRDDRGAGNRVAPAREREHLGLVQALIGA